MDLELIGPFKKRNIESVDENERNEKSREDEGPYSRGAVIKSPSSFSFYLCLFLLLLFWFFLITARTHTPPKPCIPRARHPSLPSSVRLSRLHERGKVIELYHQQSILSPYSCVMLRSEGSLQRSRLRVSHEEELIRLLQRSCSQGLIRSPYPSALPLTPEGVNG